MSGSAALIWIHALTPLRVGTDEGLGSINLPTMREVHTRHPIYPGSSLKGVLRAEIEAGDKRLARQLFGPDREHAGDHRGSLSFTDAHLIALPVRSLYGTFAWCTSAFVLSRLERDRKAAGLGSLGLPKAYPKEDVALVTRETQLVLGTEQGKRVFVEQYTLKATDTPDITGVALTLSQEIWPDDADARALFVGRFAVLPDAIFDGLTQTAMEVRTRVCINPETGTAEASGPWAEEAMPAESLLAGLALGRSTTVFESWEPDETAKTENKGKRKNEEELSGAVAMQRLAQKWPPTVLRLGGHNTVGMGRAKLRLVHGKE